MITDEIATEGKNKVKLTELQTGCGGDLAACVENSGTVVGTVKVLETKTTDESTASDAVTNYKFTTSDPALDPVDQTETQLFTLLKA